MSAQMTLSVFDSATSSPASAGGASPPDSRDGPTTANSGPARRRVSRSASRENSGDSTTSGTCGPTTFGSSVPDGPLSAWESRLRQRLARIGSTECALIWKESTTPAARSLSRLVPSMRPTAEIDCGSPERALWITASARDWKDSPGMAVTRPDGRSRVDQLPRQVAAALWPTPTASAADKSIRTPEGARVEVARGKSPDLTAHVTALWPTPTRADAARGTGTYRPHDTGIPLPQRVAQVLGLKPTGSADTTAKRGASPTLNPEFVRWLMGFPPEWGSCAPTAMPSSRKSRQK